MRRRTRKELKRRFSTDLLFTNSVPRLSRRELELHISLAAAYTCILNSSQITRPISCVFARVCFGLMD